MSAGAHRLSTWGQRKYLTTLESRNNVTSQDANTAWTLTTLVRFSVIVHDCTCLRIDHTITVILANTCQTRGHGRGRPFLWLRGISGMFTAEAWTHMKTQSTENPAVGDANMKKRLNTCCGRLMVGSVKTTCLIPPALARRSATRPAMPERGPQTTTVSSSSGLAMAIAVLDLSREGGLLVQHMWVDR